MKPPTTRLFPFLLVALAAGCSVRTMGGLPFHERTGTMSTGSESHAPQSSYPKDSMAEGLARSDAGSVAPEDMVARPVHEVQADGSNLTPALVAQNDVPLRGWDGGVVDSDPAGEVTPVDRHTHELGESTGGRMQIVELYSQALDERDALALQVEELEVALAQARGEGADVDTARGALQSKVLELEAEIQRLRAENEELAGRLTTAQIRRLEAEKILLETRIADKRRPTAGGGGAAGRIDPGGGQ